jgi:hypothetical protein
MGRVLRVGAVALLLAGPAGASCGCSSPSHQVVESADGGDAGMIFARRSEAGAPFDSGSSGYLVPSPGVLAPGVPDGWVPLTNYPNADCHFYVPGSRSLLPPPIEWQPCERPPQPAGIACEQMKITWPISPNGAIGWPTASEAWLQPDGTYTMAIVRGLPGMTYYLVADADGPVHSALLTVDETRCRPYPDDLRDGRVVYQVFEAGANGSLSEYGGGALVANIDDISPRVFLRFQDKTARGYQVGLPGLLEIQSYPINVFNLHDWTDPSKITMTWSAAQDNGLQQIPVAFQGNALLWEASTDAISKIKAWTPDRGVVDLISFGTDVTQGAANIAADGSNIVWLHATGRTSGTGVYAAVDYLTSPFTTDPVQVQARRLRSDADNHFGTGLTQIGCGFAAWERTDGFRVVQLSDGISWPLLNVAGSPWHWTEPLAVTCTHLYAAVQVQMGDGGWTSTIARVRLDSLGPGVAPN